MMETNHELYTRTNRSSRPEIQGTFIKQHLKVTKLGMTPPRGITNDQATLCIVQSLATITYWAVNAAIADLQVIIDAAKQVIIDEAMHNEDHQNIPLTGNTATKEINVTPAQIASWEGGELAQNAFPNIDAEREFIMTGILTMDWNEIFVSGDRR